jgi:pimeloyl-ACP methyl ester carboxylesterase
MYYEVHGQEHGNPLLCIHGFGASLYSWRNFVKAGSLLTANYKVITIDLKGCGKSPKPNDTKYSPQDHADLIYDFILEHDLRNLTLIGNSYGGALSLLLSIVLSEKDPGRLRSMILIDAGAYKEYVPFYLRFLSVPVINVLAAYLIPGKFAAKRVLRMAYYDPGKITAEQIEAYAAPLSAPGARHALLETGKQIIPPNIDELIAKAKHLNTPTLIIWGKQDRIISPKVGELLNQAIPNSTLKMIDQCGHVPQEEKPEETVSVVLDFLQNERQSAAGV